MHRVSLEQRWRRKPQSLWIQGYDNKRSLYWMQMIRDPFYLQIVSRLGDRLDPELFERCAADILRAELPTITPIRGGGDLGMDGAIADLDGPAFPLVCTTSEDVIGNLGQSLSSYVRQGGTRRKVVSATSRQLTAKRRRNLEQRAAEHGFDLVHIYDQAAFADRLYRNPAWCRELLNLTGTPPALSAVPRTKRPLIGDAPLGRDADLVWLRETPGDRLLVDQPGSGKTFLLYALAREGWGLFLIEADRARIAGAIRDQRPRVVIVDDAHVRIEALEQLRHLRREMGAIFDIVATSWPGSPERVAEALGLPATQVRELEPLTRDEIVTVVRGVGVWGPDLLVRAIVDQAEGRPGLAVTLADLAVRGAARDVALGEALSRNVQETFEPIVGEEGLWLLAAFAIGGDGGMPVEAVADLLGLSRIDVTRKAASLAYGGVVTQADGPAGADAEPLIVVRPSAVRPALVRDVFFNGPARLAYRPLIGRAPSLSEAARTLVGARGCGADIRSEALRAVLEQANSPEAWDEYAWLGRDEATWVVEHHQEMILDIAQSALRRAPEAALPVLLTRAVIDNRPLDKHPDHPLRQMKDWVLDADPNSGQAVPRRQDLLRSTTEWLKAGGEPAVGLEALLLGLAPNFYVQSIDPGAGRTFRWSSGLLQYEELVAIRGSWWPVIAQIGSMERPAWQHVFDLIESWAYPRRWHSEALPQDVDELVQSTAAEMLVGVVSLAKGHAGVCLAARQIAARLERAVDAGVDKDFEILYARERWTDKKSWHASKIRSDQAVRTLATDWTNENPAEIAARLVVLESLAADIGNRSSCRTPELGHQLASRVISPNAWLRAFLDSPLKVEVVAPFLHRAALSRDPGWEEMMREAMARSDLRRASIWTLLSIPAPPSALLDLTLAALPSYPSLVLDLCQRGLVTDPVLVRLLQHDDTGISGASAVGEWLLPPEGTIREPFRAYWRRAIRRYQDGEDELAEILEGNPSLSHDWLRTQLRFGNYLLGRDDGPVSAAIDALDHEGRCCILGLLPSSRVNDDFVARLISSDVDLYLRLLNDVRLTAFHLAPVADVKSTGWARMVSVALAHGVSTAKIAKAIIPKTWSWIGNESAMWSEWILDIESLALEGDTDIQAISQTVRASAIAKRDCALTLERREAVLGDRARR